MCKQVWTAELKSATIFIFCKLFSAENAPYFWLLEKDVGWMTSVTFVSPWLKCRKTNSNYFLRVIPTLIHYSDIVSDIPSGSHSFRHILWHPFWHSTWHLFWHTFWHIFWHSFWHSIWHIFWHSSWHSIWHIFGDSLRLRSGRDHSEPGPCCSGPAGNTAI